jgi:hypothetical protein
MAVRDGRNCHFGGRSWNTLGDCGWGLAVRLIDQVEIPSMQDTHAKVLFLLEVSTRVQAVPATTPYFLEVGTRWPTGNLHKTQNRLHFNALDASA